MSAKNVTIHTELLDGTLEGVRNIYMGANSTCHLYVIPREVTAVVNELAEVADQPAFYILLGSKERSAYIGQTSNFANRKNDHLQKKDWWDTALVFISDNHKIYGDDVRFLEYLGINASQEALSYKILNEANPKRPSIAPYRVNDMEVFFRDIEFLTKFYGCTIFEKMESQLDNSNVFSTSRPERGADAKGTFDVGTGKFTILKDSLIAATPTVSFRKSEKDFKKWEHWRETHCNLIKGQWVLIQDYECDSPSTASQNVLGASSNGWKDWKDKDGNTLDSIYRKPSTNLK